MKLDKSYTIFGTRNYDAVDAHAINSRINHKITLIDDTTKSIQSPKIILLNGIFHAILNTYALIWFQ